MRSVGKTVELVNREPGDTGGPTNTLTQLQDVTVATQNAQTTERQNVTIYCKMY